MKQSWLNEFKLAVIEEDIEKIEALLEKFELNKDLQELIQAEALLQEALKIVEKKKNTLAAEINKFKIAREYIKH